MNQAAPDQRTSTQHISAVIDQVLGVSDRERELRDLANAAKWDNGPALTDGEAAEYQAILDAREQKRREEFDRDRLH